MAYDTSVPNSGQSPSLFPAQAQDNFSRLKTLLGANHKFNDSAATDDGYHQDVKMLPIARTDIPNDGTIGQAFADSSLTNNELAYKDSANNVYQLTPTLPIRASVNFDGSLSGTITPRYSYNIHSVSKVVKLATGLWQIFFQDAMPSINYVVTGMVQRSGTTEQCTFQMLGGAYSDAFNTAWVKIEARNISGTRVDPTTVCVTIFGG